MGCWDQLSPPCLPQGEAAFRLVPALGDCVGSNPLCLKIQSNPGLVGFKEPYRDTEALDFLPHVLTSVLFYFKAPKKGGVKSMICEHKGFLN